jgi:predicted membrane channel-forming protein YqfA (hemolysin III family)
MKGMMDFESRIRWCGILIFIGVAIVLLSLLWKHPLSFLTFLMLGCPLVLVGVLFYLYSLSARN